MVQRVFYKRFFFYLKEDGNIKTPPTSSFYKPPLLKLLVFPAILNILYTCLNFLHILNFCVLILNNMGSGLSKAEFCIPQNSKDSWLNKCRSGSLCFSKFSLGLLVQGRAGSSSRLWAVPISKPYGVTKPSSKCWPLLCLGLGECGSGTGCGGSRAGMSCWAELCAWAVFAG